MTIRKTPIALILSSMFAVQAVQAAVDLDVQEFIKEKRAELRQEIHQPYSNKMGLAGQSVLTKGFYDSRLDAMSFNWNHGEIKDIPLQKNKNQNEQFKVSLDGYFAQVAEKHGANKLSTSEAVRTKLHNTGRGAIIAKYQQEVDGVEVFGRSINVMINQKNHFIASSGYFASNKTVPSNNYNLTASDAVAKAFLANTGQSLTSVQMPRISNSEKYQNIADSVKTNGFVLSKNSRVKKVFYPIANQQLTPAYYVEAQTSMEGSQSPKYFSYVIDGETGKVLFKNNLTSDVATTYKVFAETTGNNIPLDGPIGNALTPHPTGDLANTPAVGSSPFLTPSTITLDNAGISTDDPWLSDTQTTTSGNNVDAYADVSGEDGFDAEDIRPTQTAPNAFEYDFGSFGNGLTGDPQKHAIVSLFYMNNFLHDWFYDAGFDEAAGNAQAANLARGGMGGDAILAEGQDLSGTNNANMSTPADGGSPKMQMFLWTFLSDSNLTVTGVSNIEASAAGFGPSDYDVAGVMSLAEDGSGNGEGCNAITTDLTGMIAVIDRGNCNFTVKVKNAQDQGAVGVIMVNNVTGGVIVQGGTDDTVTIPSMMVSLEQGGEIKTALAADSTLQATLHNLQKPIDGTLDNGIVAHEWAHYLSNRLIGNGNGLSNNQGRSMGEGWSDFVALLMMTREEDNLIPGNENFQGVYSATTFVGDAYYGIRRAPYTTDTTKNALTFKHIENGVALPLSHPVAFGQSGSNNAEVHASGEIWANTLWEVYVSLINKPGNTFAQAQQQMKEYLVESLKMTPNAPTMLEARDALLAAALANDASDFALMRDAFTKHGMGASSVAPDRNSDSHANVIEDFTQGVDVSSSIAIDSATININGCDDDGILDAGETATVNLTFSNFASAATPQFNTAMSSADDITFSADTISVDALSGFGQSVSKSVQMTLNSASFMQNVSVSSTVGQIGAGVDDFVEPLAVSNSIVGNFDFSQTAMTDDMSVATASNFDWSSINDNGTTPFVVSSSRWYGVDSGAAGASNLETPLIRVAATGDLTISFDHFYFFETSEDAQMVSQNWDAGVVEVSVDGGAWQDVVDFGASLSDPYNGTVNAGNTILGGRSAYTFTRDPNDFSLHNNVLTFPGNLVNGKDIKVRFRIGTDANTSDFGWVIDNVVVTNAIDPMFSEIVAEDNICLTGSAPVVDAGSDISKISRDGSDVSTTLAATATDADGDNLTITWIQRAGPDVTINNANTLTPDFTITAPTVDTSFIFEMTANDGVRETKDSVAVNINLNQAPVVSAVGGSVTEGNSFTLSASATDNEGDSLTFAWTQTAGPSVTLSDTTVASPSFTAPTVTSSTMLTFEVVANDGSLDSAVGSATVTVNKKVEPTTSGGGGGGAFAWISLLLLGLIGSRTKKRN